MKKSNVETRHFEGTFAVAGANKKPAIVVPLLPKDGAWTITGQVVAVDEANPRHSVTFFPRFTGVCASGVVTENNTGPIAMQPKDGGKAQAWEPGGLFPIITGSRLEVAVGGIEGKTLLWAWSLDLVVVSLT